MKEKKINAVEYCAVTREVVENKIKQLLENPESKAILDQYFTWIAILNSPISITENAVSEQSDKSINSFEV